MHSYFFIVCSKDIKSDRPPDDLSYLLVEFCSSSDCYKHEELGTVFSNVLNLQTNLPIADPLPAA